MGTEESTALIVVRQLPIIEERLRDLADEIDARTKAAMSLVCTEETRSDVKKIRADLNAQFAALEEQRKAVKRAVLDPYSRFEETYKKYVSSKFKEADAILAGKIAVVEGELRQAKEEEIRAFYGEYAASLGIDFVPFERAGIKVTLSASKKSLQTAAENFLNGVGEALTLIATQENKDEILAEYKKTLNVSAAVTAVAERHRAIEQERERREAAAAGRERRKQAQEKVAAVLLAEAAAAAEAVAPPTEAEIAVPVQEPVYSMTFTVRGTKDRLKAIKQFLIDGGYDYE